MKVQIASYQNKKKFAKKSLKMSENEAKQYWLTNLLKNRFWIKFVFLNFMRILKSIYANFFTELFPKIDWIEQKKIF